jgi:hypothetical protein
LGAYPAGIWEVLEGMMVIMQRLGAFLLYAAIPLLLVAPSLVTLIRKP